MNKYNYKSLDFTNKINKLAFRKIIYGRTSQFHKTWRCKSRIMKCSVTMYYLFQHLLIVNSLQEIVVLNML